MNIKCYLLGVCLCVLGGVYGAGIGTHIEVGERIRHFLDLESQGVNYTELIRKYPGAFEAGCPYPDSYWSDICYSGAFRNASEATHWVPFIETTVDYIRDNYPRPWNETGEKLVVFLLGVVAHQVADVTWHSHYIDQGFVRTMGSVNYHDSFDASHQDADLGSDVMNHYQLPIDYMSTDWYIPVHDLLNIYDIMTSNTGIQHGLQAENIINCTKVVYLAILGENLGLLEYLYPYHGSRSPFIVDHLNDFFLGGMDDIAAWLSNVFHHTVTMLDHGTEFCHTPCQAIYIDCNTTNLYGQDNQFCAPMYDPDPIEDQDVDGNWINALADLIDEDDYVVEDTDNGITFRITDNLKNRLQDIRVRSDSPAQDGITSPDVLYTTDVQYSRLGESVLSGDINKDDHLDLVISAPGYGTPGNYQQGRVYVITGSETGLPVQNLTVETDADLTLDGPGLNGRFGTSIAFVDINADGYKDLAVGAPSIGSEQLTYHGQIYVYFGTGSSISTTPDVTITCTERYCNLGWTLSSGDVNHDGYDDLLIGAPFAPSGGEQRGFVGAMYADAQLTGGQLSETDLDWRYNGSRDYEWFGYSVAVSTLSPTTGQVTIGSPTYRICSLPDCYYDADDVQSVGKVTTFRTPLTGSPDQWYAGNTSMAQLGYSVSPYSGPSQQLLSIVASTRDYEDIDPDVNRTVDTHLGHVSVQDWSDPSWQQYFSIVGDRELCRLGTEIQYADVNGDAAVDVIVSAPLRSESFAEAREEGRVFIFYTDEAKRGQTIIADQADMMLGLGEENARYGYSVATIESDLGQLQIAVSAPHSGHGGRLAGLVALHQF